MNTVVKHKKLHDSEEGIKFKSGESYFHQPAGLMLVISSIMAVAFLTSVLLWPYDGMSEFKFYTHYVLLVVALHNAISKVVLTVLSHADECINKYSPSMRKHEFLCVHAIFCGILVLAALIMTGMITFNFIKSRDRDIKALLEMWDKMEYKKHFCILAGPPVLAFNGSALARLRAGWEW